VRLGALHFFWMASLVMFAGEAHGQVPEFRMAWVVVDVPEATGPVIAVKGKPIPFAKIAPADPMWLATEVRDTNGKVILPAGSILAKHVSLSSIACEPMRRAGQGSFVCLIDGDADNKFDRYSRIEARQITQFTSRSFEYLVGVFSPNGGGPLSLPVGADDFTSAREVFGLELSVVLLNRLFSGGAAFALCTTREWSKTIWGNKIESELCSSKIYVDKVAVPTIHREAGGRMDFRFRDPQGFEVSLKHPTIGLRIFG